jgi:hypothetical protein
LCRQDSFLFVSTEIVEENRIVVANAAVFTRDDPFVVRLSEEGKAAVPSTIMTSVRSNLPIGRAISPTSSIIVCNNIDRHLH